MKMNKKTSDNILLNNPVLVQSLGFVSVLAVSRTMTEALAMTLAVVFTLLASSLFVSIFKNIIDEDFEVIALTVISALFAIIAELLIKTFFPEIAGQLGIYASLIAVNSLILNRLRLFAIVESPGSAIADAVTNGIGYGLVIMVMAFIRELLGKGTLFGFRIIPEEFTMASFSEPMWAFILMGLFIAWSNSYVRKKKLKGAR